jgi:hypothetical protein
MYLTCTDFENNSYLLEKALKTVVKKSIRGKFDILYIAQKDTYMVLDIHILRASTERPGYLSYSYRLQLDQTTGAFVDSENHWAPMYILNIVSLWPKHIKAVKKYRSDLIKEELIKLAIRNPTCLEQ